MMLTSVMCSKTWQHLLRKKQPGPAMKCVYFLQDNVNPHMAIQLRILSMTCCWYNNHTNQDFFTFGLTDQEKLFDYIKTTYQLELM